MIHKIKIPVFMQALVKCAIKIEVEVLKKYFDERKDKAISKPNFWLLAILHKTKVLILEL